MKNNCENNSHEIVNDCSALGECDCLGMCLLFNRCCAIIIEEQLCPKEGSMDCDFQLVQKKQIICIESVLRMNSPYGKKYPLCTGPKSNKCPLNKEKNGNNK